jgi:lysophospholipase L1-like esterase
VKSDHSFVSFSGQAALRSLIVAGLAFAVAGCDVLKSGTEPTDPTPTVELNYDAIGASDTIGIGSSAPCLPFVECFDGPGYVQRVARRFKSDGRTVTLNNLGVPGAVLSPAVQAIGNSVGLEIFRNMLTDGGPNVRRSATLVTMFIGANDANAIGRAVRAGMGGPDITAYGQAHIQNFARDSKTLVSLIRGRAPAARIVALNLPNMANTPYANPLTRDEKRYLQGLTVGFSAGINALTADGVIVIDLMCDPTFYSPGIFSPDGFHPNDAGYAYLADLVYAAANTGAATAPRASCAQMTVF